MISMEQKNSNATIKLQFRPGINNDIAFHTPTKRWNWCTRQGQSARFRLGFPEKIGGWENTQVQPLGTARALHNWISLDGSDFQIVGTHKYYIERLSLLTILHPYAAQQRWVNSLLPTAAER